jgi:sugar phosphate isomerase/epimerase
MRISAFPKCWLEQICDGRMSLESWIRASGELDCDGLELYSGFLASQDAGYLRGVRRSVEALGMCIPMLCCSPDFTVEDPAERNREVERELAMIRALAAMGGSFCRVLSGQARPGLGREEGIERVVSSIERCLPVAEECRVTLVIENHYKDGFWKYREFAQKKDLFVSIVERIDSPWFGVQFDPSNAVVAGDDPLEVLEAVLPRVRTVHASDRSLAPGSTLEDLRQADGTLGYAPALVHGVTGKGLNDWHGIFSRLATLGREDLWVSIEDGMNGMGEMKESVDFLKRMRARHFRTA